MTNNKDNHRKKKPFFKVFKSSWYNIYDYGIKEKRQKKVTTTMVDFNNKFPNDSLIDTGIRVDEITGG